MIFYLGTHLPHWLSSLDIPLFVSRRRLEGRKTYPRAKGRWALDSGGFSEITMHGEWKMSAPDYATFVDEVADEIGNLDWAAPQDWMCEPHMIQNTGLSIQEHQERTIDSVHELRSLTDVPVIPVLQGWELSDYLDHVEMYDKSGIDLCSEPVVGLGSVCRRQGTVEAAAIVHTLSDLGIRLHCFGFKVAGLLRVNQDIVSADSMAWSFKARQELPLPGCDHMNCANCIRYAVQWYEDLMGQLDKSNHQLRLAVA